MYSFGGCFTVGRTTVSFEYLRTSNLPCFIKKKVFSSEKITFFQSCPWWFLIHERRVSLCFSVRSGFFMTGSIFKPALASLLRTVLGSIRTFDSSKIICNFVRRSRPLQMSPLHNPMINFFRSFPWSSRSFLVITCLTFLPAENCISWDMIFSCNWWYTGSRLVCFFGEGLPFLLRESHFFFINKKFNQKNNTFNSIQFNFLFYCDTYIHYNVIVQKITTFIIYLSSLLIKKSL